MQVTDNPSGGARLEPELAAKSDSKSDTDADADIDGDAGRADADAGPKTASEPTELPGATGRPGST